MIAPTAAGKRPENNAAKAGKSRAAHPTLLKVENESFASHKHLLCSHQRVGRLKERCSYARHTFMPVTYLFVSFKRCPSSPQLQGFKTTLINTWAHTHSPFLILPFSPFLMHTNLWGRIVEAEKRRAAQANEGWQDVYVTPKPPEPEAIKGLARLTQASQLQWPVLGERVLKWGAAASSGPDRTLSQLSLPETWCS